MDSLSCAVAFARGLLALGRARATGVLEVRAPTERSRIAIVAGVPRAVSSTAGTELLGDILMRAGDFDQQAHRVALAAGQPHGPVGAWLVGTGTATRPAVAHALRSQLRKRLLSLLAQPELDYHFVAGSAAVDAPWVDDPETSFDLVLSALRGRVTSETARRVLREHHGQPLAPAPHFERELCAATLWPDEAALLSELWRGRALSELEQDFAGCERALGTLAALLMLAVIAPEMRNAASYPLLVQKQRQLRRQASASELLELHPQFAKGEARRALRRLAHKLHPDTLEPSVPAAVRAASTRTMSALARAESELRDA